MAIDKKLIYQNRTLSQFKKQQSDNGDLTANNNSIVFLSDGFIWTHGTFYDGRAPVETGVSTGNFTLGTDWVEIPEGLYGLFFTSSGSYLVQIEFGDLIYTGYIPYKEQEYQSHVDANGTFDHDNCVNTSCEIPLSLCGYDDGRGRLFLKIGVGNRKTTVLAKTVVIDGKTVDTSEFAIDSAREAVIKPSLFICADKEVTDVSGLTFKFKKLI